MKFTQLPETEEIKKFLNEYVEGDFYSENIFTLLEFLIKLDISIKFNTNPKMYIEAQLLAGFKGE